MTLQKSTVSYDAVRKNTRLDEFMLKKETPTLPQKAEAKRLSL